MLENKVNIRFSEEEKSTLAECLKTITQVLGPKLISLTSNQRKELPKMGDGTEPFVEKTVDYLKSNPEFLPPYLNVEDLEIDFETVKTLNEFYRPLLQLLQNMDDTIMMAGSEAYVAALSYYNSVKHASRVNVPNSKPIYEDLKQRFS